MSMIVKLVAAGMTEAEIRGAYPYLEVEDFRAALTRAALLADEQVVPATPDAGWCGSPSM